MSPATISEIGVDAIAEVMDVMGRAFDPGYGEAWNEAQCRAMIGLPGVWLALARDPDGRALGFNLCRAVLDDAELLLIATLPDCRGQGIGRALLAAAIAGASDRGALRLHLEVREDNPALGFYERQGFERCGRRPAYYRGVGGEMRDALTLTRRLGRG